MAILKGVVVRFYNQALNKPVGAMFNKYETGSLTNFVLTTQDHTYIFHPNAYTEDGARFGLRPKHGERLYIFQNPKLTNCRHYVNM